MSSLETTMVKARSAEKKGDFTEAERLYGAVLQKFPGNARARKGMDALFKARALAMLKADAPPQAAIDALSQAYDQGHMAQVAAQAEALIEQYPRSALVHNLLGAALLKLGHPARAEAVLRQAHARGVRHPALCNNLGIALARIEQHGEAIGFYREAIALDPNYAIAHNNLGNALKECDEPAEAAECYRRAIAIQPDYADAHNNLGLALDKLGCAEEAQAAYRKVLALQPNHAAACNNLANVLADLGNLAGAERFYDRALAIDPDYPAALYNLGNLYRKQGRLDAAIASFTEALAIEPSHTGALLHRLFYQAHVCDWSAFDAWRTLGESADTEISPFASLTFEDDPAAQLRRSRARAAKTFGQRPAIPPRPAPAADGRIRIGYFSADFHDHATLYLMGGLLREHDRSRFEIHAFSYGPQLDGAMRRHLVAHADSFTEVGEMSDADLVALARGRNLDIAVDLKGYTQNGRLRPFALRLAPVQVAYLGYPGSCGASFIDYLVADPVVVPAAERAHYSEKLIVLPGSYQPNDDQRAIAGDAGTRAGHGLPEDAFVFCSFNQSYKITPREWAIWMRLMHAVEGSVLWLLRSNQWAEANLRAEAAKAGIAPDRLVFADKLDHAAHLARHRHADLFLDSFAVNAHTTASDALWAGLPVITLAGRQFAARVAASLLHAVGLPELVTTSEQAYEALALDLATRPEKLAEVKAQLAANRLAAPLFDTARYTRQLEQGFEAAHRHHAAGKSPEDIAVG